MQTVLTLALSTEPSPQLQILFYSQFPSTEESGSKFSPPFSTSGIHGTQSSMGAGKVIVILRVILFEFRCSSSIIGCAILVVGEEGLICLKVSILCTCYRE